MAKYGRGLAREILGGVNRNEIPRPFNLDHVRSFLAARDWRPPSSYVNVVLANSTSPMHSHTYKKYFVLSAEDGHGDRLYDVAPPFVGSGWV